MAAPDTIPQSATAFEKTSAEGVRTAHREGFAELVGWGVRGAFKWQ